ncbi:MAG: AEC family transporter [Rhodocyclaceae bacterium]|nr:AEC family transporter [Rhodocyclaceae bacterium]MBX3669064.1 AEC family transporter [Rhodocyclaceae bacterium]
MFERIVSIVFPVFAVVIGGWFYGRRHKPDMAIANRLNMDVFVPALIFSALADKSFDLAANQIMAWGGLIQIAASGLIGWGLARMLAIDARTFVPPMMFNNIGNLGLPLSVLAFGDQALGLAVVVLMMSNMAHFSFGAWLLDHRVKWWLLWRNPVVAASLVGLTFSLMHVPVWQPLKLAIKMVGDISIPLLLFSLGVRVADSALSEIRVGLIGAVARPLMGLAIAWPVTLAFGVTGMPRALLLLYGALPPAVLNFVFAERYNQEPAKVASIVLLGNVLAVAVMPAVLAVVLE